MRFFVLGAAISALAAVAAAVPSTEGKLTPDETKHMKESIMSMSKAINTKSCDVAKSQVLCLHNMIQDYSVQGHVTGERDEVKYITMEDGDNMVKNLWNVRNDAEKKGRDEASSEMSSEESLDEQRKKGGNRKGKGRFRGGKGRGGKGRGGSRGGSRSGSRGGGGRGRGGRSLESLESFDEEDSMGAAKISCSSAQRILKVVRDFAPKSVKVGTTPDNKCAYYIYPKEEKTLKSKVRKAFLRG